MRKNYALGEHSTNNSEMKAFDFDGYSWPPKDWNGDTSRFITCLEFLAKGAFRSVYFAYDSKTDQPLVLKKFTEYHPKEERFWKEDINSSKVAQHFAEKFNKELLSSKSVRFVEPIIDIFADGGKGVVNGETILIEPYLGHDYIKFNSNSGWQDDESGMTMGALSHFSYHSSGGTRLLCDLQGIKTDNEYILTDPAICSLSRSFGLTDLGYEGILSFFKQHKCNPICDPKWIKPKAAPCYIVPKRTTYFRK